MASEFQRRKIGNVFHAMDVDHNDFLEEDDFRALVDRWNGLRGYQPGSPEGDRIDRIMMGWWAALVANADQNRDGKVSLDELMILVDQLPGARDQVVATAEAMFGAIDADGDGGIGLDEYKQMVQVWTQAVAGTDEIFPLLDANGDGQISWEEFSDLWCGFWIDDDESDPSKWVFGPF